MRLAAIAALVLAALTLAPSASAFNIDPTPYRELVDDAVDLTLATTTHVAACTDAFDDPTLANAGDFVDAMDGPTFDFVDAQGDSTGVFVDQSDDPTVDYAGLQSDATLAWADQVEGGYYGGTVGFGLASAGYAASYGQVEAPFVIQYGVATANNAGPLASAAAVSSLALAGAQAGPTVAYGLCLAS